MNLWGPIGVAWFEMRRSFTPGRLLLWLLMAGFPVMLISLVRLLEDRQPPDEAFTLVLFALIVRVSCVMGLLLWATPVISSEIEGRTWLYVVSRPTGSRSMVLGKFLVAILWAISAGVMATSVAVPASGISEPWRLWWVLCFLVVLGSLAYGAMLSLIGALVQKRAMVVAIIYLVFIEGLISIIPASINRLTVGYRLLGLLTHWMGLRREDDFRLEMLFGTAGPLFNVTVLLGYTGLLLLLAIFRVRLGGYLTASED